MQALRVFLGFIACASVAVAQPMEASSAAALRAKHDELLPKLEGNAFGRPLQIFSREGGRELKGDIYAIVEFPFARVDSALGEAPSWCDVMILPFNTKHCYASARDGATFLSMRIGRKYDQPAELAYPIEFRYRVVARSADYLRVMLKADSGPIGTRDYLISLEATPLENGRTFIHLGYSYGFGVLSRLAMQAYLGTLGKDKVGFTVVGRDDQNRPAYVGGLLGALERNTMRYFLAIDAYLASLSAPPEARVAKRLDDWFLAAEKYPRQLHEMDRGEYIAMKRKETQRLHAQL